MIGGSANDVVFGDFEGSYVGDSQFSYEGIAMRSSNFSVSEPGKDDNERVVARSGGGGRGDLTDGVIRNATNIISVSYASGGGPGDLADGGFAMLQRRSWLVETTAKRSLHVLWHWDSRN